MIAWKARGQSIQSDLSWVVRDSVSAMVLGTPGTCWAVRMIFLLRAHIHNYFSRSVSWHDTVPPMLLMLATAVALSSWRSTDTSETSFRKVFTANIAAGS